MPNIPGDLFSSRRATVFSPFMLESEGSFMVMGSCPTKLIMPFASSFARIVITAENDKGTFKNETNNK